MLDPLILLTAFATIVTIAVIAFYPQHGVVPRIRRILRLSGRVRLEDALKHGLHEQLEGRFATINSIAGALEITRRGATALVWELEHLGFITVDEGGVHLTETGHAYATRVVRNHRLWERYLADRTAVQPAAWHEKAEIAEHRLTEHDANRLAARMGYPLFDPHGDPIPTERGDLPVVDGVALTELRAGQHATIVHIEDEPVEIFERIVSEGFRPLMRLKVLDVSPTKVVVSVEGEQHTLDPLVARNFTVHPIAAADDREDVLHTLAEVRPGYEATVIRISSRSQGPPRRRLLDLGVIPGTVIQAEFESAPRDPVAYRIRGAVIALRRAQAEQVYVDDIREVSRSAAAEERHAGVV